MAYRTRRQHRYELLRKAGFLPIEAKELSRIPLKVPYMSRLMRERFETLEKAIEEDWTQKQYRKYITDYYVENKWIRTTRIGKVTIDPWKMLRDFEHAYRAKYPEYESPWQERRRRWKDFVTKLEATYAKYPKKMPRVKLRYKPEGGAEIVEE